MNFEAENIYHVYNRGNNKQPIFFEEENYLFFLKKIRKHLLPHVDLLAYCLMPNHFHLMIYVPELNRYRTNPSDGLSSIRPNPSEGLSKTQSKTISN